MGQTYELTLFEADLFFLPATDFPTFDIIGTEDVFLDFVVHKNDRTIEVTAMWVENNKTIIATTIIQAPPDIYNA